MNWTGVTNDTPGAPSAVWVSLYTNVNPLLRGVTPATGKIRMPSASSSSSSSASSGRDMGRDAGDDWWIDAVEVDTTRMMSLDGEGGLWTSTFVPPPPRPDFLVKEAVADGVTTCDLCTWAWHHPSVPESLGDRDFGWVMTLVVVSLLSALIGAIVMITVIRCRNRLKHLGRNSGTCPRLQGVGDLGEASLRTSIRSANRGRGSNSKELENGYEYPGGKNEERQRHRLWSWLTRRSAAAPIQLGLSAPTAPDNHYTVEEVYPGNGEALYAELDRDSSNSPAYENTAYTGSATNPDFPPSSARSSAYYSDLSRAPSDRTYETVCQSENGQAACESRRPPKQVKWTCANETVTVPSDYV